jgi:outer membrane receptor for ferric coprogen and ferric-rhodotorulic acid
MFRLSDETPRHLANLWLSGQLPGVLNRFAVGSTVHAQSSNSKSGTVCANAECSAIRDFKVEQGTYMVVDARTSYQVDAHWRAALSIVNVFDRRYLQTVALPSGGNWFGEPRGFLFRLDGRF